MELTPEVIEAAKLSPEQVTAVKTFGENHVADIKKGFDDKANKDAEGILTGVADYLQKKTGVAEPRQQGEKYADYLTRISDKFLESKSQTLEQVKAEYEAKVKDFKGDDLLKADLDKAKADYDALQKKYADYDDILAKASKYEPLEKEHESLKLNTAFTMVKPAFPEAVNQYEAAAKWKEFVDKVLEKNTIQIVEGEPVAIDKENQHKQKKLKDLVAADETITALVAGRQQAGLGAKEVSTETIEGVPFAVPKEHTTIERSKLIREYLTKEGLNPASSEYSNRFADLNNKILNKGK
jgi:hypothetical protein